MTQSAEEQRRPCWGATSGRSWTPGAYLQEDDWLGQEAAGGHDAVDSQLVAVVSDDRVGLGEEAGVLYQTWLHKNLQLRTIRQDPLLACGPRPWSWAGCSCPA